MNSASHGNYSRVMMGQEVPAFQTLRWGSERSCPMIGRKERKKQEKACEYEAFNASLAGTHFGGGKGFFERLLSY